MNIFSLLFLYLVLPLSALVYFLLPDIRRKNLALSVISLVMYGLAQPLHILLMVVLSYLNYRFAVRIDPEERGSVLLPAVLNVGILAGFKYFSLLLELFGVSLGGFEIMPIGLSIFVFSAISYLADVYLGTVEPEEKFSNLLLYSPSCSRVPLFPMHSFAISWISEELPPEAASRAFSASFSDLRRRCCWQMPAVGC